MKARYPFALALVFSVAACSGSGPLDLGTLDPNGAADSLQEIDLEIPAADGGKPGQLDVELKIVGRTSLTAKSSESSPTGLQMHAKSSLFRRKSYRSANPQLTLLPGAGAETPYEMTFFNFDEKVIKATLRVEASPEPGPGIEAYFNAPDCDGACADDRLIRDPTDASNGLRRMITEAVQEAKSTIDLAIFGLEDEGLEEALCKAVARGVRVRIVTDWRSLDPGNSRGYFSAVDNLIQCGADAQFVMNNAIMHHKFFLIDADSDNPHLVTGSCNQTTTGMEKNHNHMLSIRGAPGLVEAFANEFDQLHEHCVNNKDRRGNDCDECTATCINDVSEEGPYDISVPQFGDIQAYVYYSPSLVDSDDDALRALRGPVAEREVKVAKTSGADEWCVYDERGPQGARQRVDYDCHSSKEAAEAQKDTVRKTPDEACIGPEADCVCFRDNRGYFSCDYCGGASGNDYGIIGEANERVYTTVFSATDQCFGLALAQAAHRGLDTLAIFDRVNSFGQYTRDDFVCSMGVPTYTDDWSGKSAVIFNHNKIIVTDDKVFDGSMNISASGGEKNNENTIVYQNADLADVFAEYVRAEVNLLIRRGEERGEDNRKLLRDCTCNDGIDNDGDGQIDTDVANCGEQSCIDEEDNDGDGDVDFDDSDCHTSGE